MSLSTLFFITAIVLFMLGLFWNEMPKDGALYGGLSAFVAGHLFTGIKIGNGGDA